MDRRRAYEREQFTYEEKRSICLKSDDRCCHCGKLRYINYGATVDHFIPLFKGGSNRAINLVMLCEECNKEKGDKIMDMTYLPYLKKEYRDELSKYLDSYIAVIDYIARNRLFACDEYTILLQSRSAENALQFKRNYKNSNILNKGFKYKLKLAGWDDYQKICDYFEKYLKKYNNCDGRSAVENNITFWMTFGCIYYIERQGEIALMTVFTVKHAEDCEVFEDIEYIPTMYNFSYYASESAVSLCVGTITRVLKYILEEQRIKFMPITINLMDSDNITPKIIYHLREIYGKDLQLHPGTRSGFSRLLLVIDSCESDEEYKKALVDEEKQKVLAFSNKFGDVEDKIKAFFENSGDSMEKVSWMVKDLLGFKYIREAKLTKLVYDKTEDEIEDAIREQEKKEIREKKARLDKEDMQIKKMYAKLIEEAENNAKAGIA